MPSTVFQSDDNMQERGFVFDDSIHRAEAFARMNTMRKEGHFCDAVLEVSGKSVFVHRVVLASSNVFFFELFSRSEDNGIVGEGRPIFKLDEFDLDFAGVDLLVSYFYSAKLQCDFHLVQSLYKAAITLKVPRVTEQCSQYLVQCLTPQNCLGTYKFAALLEGRECMKKVAFYIQDNIHEVLESSSEFAHLPCIVVDIVGAVSPDFYITEQPLCKLVVSWLHDEVAVSSLNRLVEDPHVLLLTPDNKLIDCCQELPDSSLNDSDVIKDYKKLCDRKHSFTKNGDKRPKQSGSPGSKSPLPHFSDSEEEHHCCLVASTVVADKSFMCIAVLNKKLASVSIKFRSEDSLRKADAREAVMPDADSPSAIDRKQSQCLMTQLSSMSVARCGFGVAVVDRNIVAVGGYGRGECLNSVESYNLLTNCWTPLKPMQKVRGRFSTAVVDGKLLACGGSDGTAELNSAEAYDPPNDSWSSLPDMIYRKSSAGVAMCNGKLYVIGGLSGSNTLSSCEVYEPSLKMWKKVSSLKTGRSQAAVCSYGPDYVVALGGCNAWNCMNSCEIYDPATDAWSDLPSLAIARRGAGAAYFQGMLYVAGGSDAQVSLTSVEIYDPETSAWFFGPNLGVPRANMGVAVLDDTRMFVLGGFSGKTFLKSLEYLAYGAEEWCSFLPSHVDVEAILRSDSPQRNRVKNGQRGSYSRTISSNSVVDPVNESNERTEGVDVFSGFEGVANPVRNSEDCESSCSCSLEELHKEKLANGSKLVSE